MKEPLTIEEFEKRLKEKNNIEKLYKMHYSNYPNSIFYYDTPFFDGTTDNIGIYTTETIYSLDPA